MIRLTEDDKLSFDGNIRKICLPNVTSPEPNKWFGNQIHLVGYGKTRQDSTSQLRAASMAIMPNYRCEEQHVKGKDLYQNILISLPDEPMIKKNQLCSGVTGFFGDDTGSCAGDSGSPMIFYDWKREAFSQLGVLHGGVTQCSSNVLPSIYTRLDDPSILQFINNELNKTSKLDF